MQRNDACPIERAAKIAINPVRAKEMSIFLQTRAGSVMLQPSSLYVYVLIKRSRYNAFV